MTEATFVEPQLVSRVEVKHRPNGTAVTLFHPDGKPFWFNFVLKGGK